MNISQLILLVFISFLLDLFRSFPPNSFPHHENVMSQIYSLFIYCTYICVLYVKRVSYFSPSRRTIFHFLGGDTVPILNVCIKPTHDRPTSLVQFLVLQNSGETLHLLSYSSGYSFSASSFWLLRNRPFWPLRNNISDANSWWLLTISVLTTLLRYNVASLCLP